jgi:flagellar assembly protein FliH
MASIIRSPAIADERRKLTSRRPPSAEAAAIVPSTEASPVHAPEPKPAAPDVQSLVAQARESVLAQFKDEAEKARELGRQRGLQEGRLAGAEEAKKSFESELARVRSIAGKLQQAVESGIRGMEDVAIAIAFEATCKMLGTAAVTREGIQGLVKEAVAHAINTERVVVRLHAGDLSALREVDALDTALQSGTQVSWVADDSIELGGCVVETDGGELDARLETQVERLRATLVAARRA